MNTIVEELDLRALSRDPYKILTTIEVFHESTRIPWLKLGDVQLRERPKYHFPGIWALSAYLSNATDFEHDPAYLLRMELVGLQLESVEYGNVQLTGFVHADDPDAFRVPGPDYAPLRSATKCTDKYCRRQEPHLIVGEGNYVPKANIQLYETVRGKRISIRMGATPKVK